MPLSIQDLIKAVEKSRYTTFNVEAKANYTEAVAKFGKNFRLLREKAGLTLTDVAKKCCVSKVYLSDVELGRRAPNDKILNIEF